MNQRKRVIKVFAAIASLLVSLGHPVKSAPAFSSTVQWPNEADRISLSISADRATYVLGEPIKVQITIKNISRETLQIFGGSPWHQVLLSIHDSHEALVKPTSFRDPTTFHGLIGGGAAAALPPGKSVTYGWDGQTFVDIDHWGYIIKAPGTYTIQATPQIVGFVASPDQDAELNRFTATGPTTVSNVVRLIVR